VLGQHGYRVLAARNAEEAIGIAETMSEPIGLLLTDVVMPGRSGPALAVRLREKQPALPCLFMSGYTDDALKNHGVTHATGGYVQKPFRPAVLLKKVQEQLETRVPSNQ
jgi:DNA-binding response OmpR family regulator